MRSGIPDAIAKKDKMNYLYVQVMKSMKLRILIFIMIGGCIPIDRGMPVDFNAAPKVIETGGGEIKGLGWMFGRISPIGFSRDGKFAYVAIFSISPMAPELQSYRLIIHDLVTDLVVWEWATQVEGLSGKADRDALWAEALESAEQKLNQYEIEPVKEMSTSFGSRFYDGETEYEVTVSPATLEKEFYYPDGSGTFTEDIILESEVFISSPQLGRKRVFSGETGSDTIQTDIVGAVLSPFESRAAIFFAMKHYGYQLEYTYSFIVIGAHLTVNFK
jgi:hypothetical protein